MSEPFAGEGTEIFHEPEVASVSSSRPHFTFDRALGSVGENAVDQGSEDEIEEHLHGRAPEYTKHRFTGVSCRVEQSALRAHKKASRRVLKSRESQVVY